MSLEVEINPGEILLSLRSENKMEYEPEAVRRRGTERDYSELDTQKSRVRLQTLHGDFSSFRNAKGNQLIKYVRPGVRAEPILRKQSQLSL